jgi:DNA polymerase-3 subunit delta'
LYQCLARRPLDPLIAGQQLQSFIDEAGKDAGPRRGRLRQVIRFAAELYRQVVRQQAGIPAEGDEPLRRAAVALAGSRSGDPEQAATCLERCLEALEHVDRNANQATLIECWLHDLARMAP